MKRLSVQRERRAGCSSNFLSSAFLLLLLSCQCNTCYGHRRLVAASRGRPHRKGTPFYDTSSTISKCRMGHIHTHTHTKRNATKCNIIENNSLRVPLENLVETASTADNTSLSAIIYRAKKLHYTLMGKKAGFGARTVIGIVGALLFRVPVSSTIAALASVDALEGETPITTKLPAEHEATMVQRRVRVVF